MARFTLKKTTAVRVLLGLSMIAVQLATTAFAQTPVHQQSEVVPPASQTAPWLQPLPTRRGLEPRPTDTRGPIDINSATVKELIGLKDIGRTRADDIIKGRPYKDKYDLVKRKILPPEVFAEIKNAIVAHRK
jgi:DNA uptake protein ComE-like DNA-binding protein